MTNTVTYNNAEDLLNNFYEDYSERHIKLYLKLTRYISLVLYINIRYNIELHKPRICIEKFSYESDKLWSKIIYFILYLNTNTIQSRKIIYQYIHIGGYVNLIKYWYDKIIKNDKFESDKKYYESYTFYDATKSDSVYEAKKDIHITNALYFIINNVYGSDYNLCKTMLKYLINESKISNNIIIQFSNYLNNLNRDPCLETERKIDIYNLIYDFISY